MRKENKAILWEELNWKEIEKLTTNTKMVIIPIGACEQHGPHLPLAVDTIDCYEVAKRVSAKTGVPVILLLCTVVRRAMAAFQVLCPSDQKR